MFAIKYRQPFKAEVINYFLGEKKKKRNTYNSAKKYLYLLLLDTHHEPLRNLDF